MYNVCTKEQTTSLDTMRLLQAVILVLVLFATETKASCGYADCGCIYIENAIIPEQNYVCEPIRTDEFQNFLHRLEDDLYYNENAEKYIDSLPSMNSPPSEPGSPLCKSKQKKILGYWKNLGTTLCWVVEPHKQNIEWTECISTTCCGDNSRCELDGYVLTKYLVYCSAYYSDYDGCLQQLHVDEEKSSPPGFKISKKRDVERATNVTLPIEKRNSCPHVDSYFAYKHEYLPSTCTCQKCDC